MTQVYEILVMLTSVSYRETANVTFSVPLTYIIYYITFKKSPLYPVQTGELETRKGVSQVALFPMSIIPVY